MARKLEVEFTADDKTKGAIASVSSGLSGVSNLVGSALKTGFVAMAGGAAIGTAAISKFVAEASESEQAQARLNSVLASTGGQAGVTADAANELASSLQKVTRFSDDTVTSAQAVLLQFRAIGQDTFPQATEMTLDLATALGVDAPSAARLLGKALETPGEGLAKLKAAGVAFSDQQTEQIKQMVEVGNTAGAQKLIMDELAKTVGGAAKASGQTFAGQLDILNNQLSDVMEEIGGAFLPIIKDLVAGINTELIPVLKEWATENVPKIRAAMKQLGEWFKQNFPAIKKQVVEVAAEIKKWLDGATKQVEAFWRDVEPILKDFQKWLQTDGIAALKVFFDKMGELQGVQDEWKATWRLIVGDSKGATDDIVKDAGIQLPKLADIIGWTMDNMKIRAEAGWKTLRFTISGYQKLTQGDMNGFAEDMQAANYEMLRGMLAAVGITMPKTVAEFRNNMQAMFNEAVTWGSNILASISSSVSSWLNSIVARASDFMNSGRTLMQNVLAGVSGFFDAIRDTILAPFQNAVVNILTFDWIGTGREVMQNIWQGISFLAGNVASGIKGAFDSAYNAIFDTDWWGVGYRVMDAIRAGLEYVRDRVAAAIQGPLQSLIDILNRLFGAGSPMFGNAMGLQLAPTMASGGTSTTTTNNYYNLTISSNATVEQVAADFQIMKVMNRG